MIAFSDYSNEDVASAIDQWVKNEKYRAIAKRRLIDGIGYEYIAEEFEYSRTQIINIIRKCEYIILDHIAK